MKTTVKTLTTTLGLGMALLALSSHTLKASSHMDAPLIVLDPAANTTDVYAFRSDNAGTKFLTVALAVYPFEEPGIGPNRYNFDPNVLYVIHVSRGADLAAGRPTTSYQFRFRNDIKNPNTILQSYLGTVQDVGDAKQNLTQHYSLTKVNNSTGVSTVLFSDNLVPPNNQGLVTPLYNQGDVGDNNAKEGVAVATNLDHYTQQTVYTSSGGYMAFAGQRDDGFYADIQALFDLNFSFSGAKKPFDSQAGFNVHTMVINIPLSDIGGDQQAVGVYASTYRQQTTVLRAPSVGPAGVKHEGPWIQVGRQGNPLFCEALVAGKDKDLYNQLPPTSDTAIFKKYALTPELAAALGLPANNTTNRTDLAGIFIPDLIKVDLSTGPARLAGGSNPGAAPDDVGFNRLGVFGGGTNAAGGTAGPDVLISNISIGFLNAHVLPGGWPNGRRFGDDVVDIAILALESDLRNPASPTLANAPADPGIDRVDHNDIGYNKVFPYAATPNNGASRQHPQPIVSGTVPSA